MHASISAASLGLVACMHQNMLDQTVATTTVTDLLILAYLQTSVINTKCPVPFYIDWDLIIPISDPNRAFVTDIFGNR